MRVWTTVAAALALALGAAGQARAATLYASAQGDDDVGADCTVRSAPCSFNRAVLSVSADGDVIEVAPGLYTDHRDQAPAHRVTVEGVRGNAPTLDVRTLQLPSGSALRDVIVRGYGDPVLRAASSTVERVDVADSSAAINTICEFDGPGTRVYDTACWTTGGAGAIQLDRTPLSAPGDFVLRHVTAFSAGAALTAYDQVTATVTNSILAGSPDVTAYGSAAVSVDHSRVTGTGFTNAGANLATPSEAIFPDLGAGDLHPAAGSPEIDAGTADGAPAGETDLGGGPRALGSAPDMGAYEWVPSAPVVATGDVTAIGTSAATVPGTVDARGAATTFVVQFGTTPAYGSTTAPASAGSATRPVDVSADIGALAEGVLYHYRVVAVNAYGTSTGADKTFTALIGPEYHSWPALSQPPTLTPAVKAKPKVTITMPATTHCRPARTYSVRARIASGAKISSVEVYLNGKRKTRVTGVKALKAITLKSLPKTRYTLEVRVKTSDGRTEKLKRTYRTCASAR